VSIQSVTSVLPAGDLHEALAIWRAILGVEPAFVDGERWAQFNVGPARIALAAADQADAAPGLMIKTSDLEAQRARLTEAGVPVSEIKAGPHENFFTVQATQGWHATFYCPR
jgi:glyoxalase/bleomycin resistance protein/dioxygenase superfamily protein